MNPVNEMRNHLRTLKIHLDQVDQWVMQATDMIYEIEEKLMDIEDAHLEKLDARDNIYFLKEVATEHPFEKDSPPRHRSSRHSKHNTDAVGFFQSDFGNKKIV